MKRKKLVLSIVTAAALSGFGAAHAQTEVTANPNVGVDASVGSTSEQSSSSSALPSTSVDSATDAQAGASADGSASASAGATGSEEGRHPHGKARGHDPDRAKGLDRADEVAGIHGQHGRDNAREKQDRN